MTVVASELHKRVLRLCGQMGAPGRSPSQEQQEEFRDWLNQTLDAWGAKAELIFNQAVVEFTLVPDQAEYTIGPSGGDVTAARPISISKANIIQTNANPVVRIPLTILDDDQWPDISVRDYPTSIPTMMYYNKNNMGSVLGTITFVGTPDTAYDCELYVQTPFDSDTNINTSIILPEGYIDALVYTMAEKMAPLYWKKSNGALAELKDMARKARASLMALNTQPLKQGSDAPNGSTAMRTRGPYFNYLNGDARPRN